MVEFVVAIDEARVRFTDDALLILLLSFEAVTSSSVIFGIYSFEIKIISLCFFFYNLFYPISPM